MLLGSHALTETTAGLFRRFAEATGTLTRWQHPLEQWPLGAKPAGPVRA
jgi:hypothetical protein